MQYSLKVIFISLLVRPAFFAALGKFHFAANNISIDCRVSGLILVTLKNFLIKRWRIKIHKKVIGSKICRVFLPRFLELKVDFTSDKRIGICQSTFRHLVTTEFQHGHELIYGVTLYGVFITTVRVKIESPLGRVDDDTGEILVLH